MMTRKLPTALLMFVWLTIGYAVIHVVLAMWGLSIVQSIVNGSRIYEHLQVFEDDGPLIISYGGGWQKAAYRHLDGTAVTGSIGKQMNGVFLQIAEPGRPRSWDARMASFTDFRSPAVNWYLVIPPSRSQTAYFTGFEQLSRRHVGYLGVEGFSLQVPEPQHSFHIPTEANNSFLGRVAATQTDRVSSPYEIYSGGYTSKENDMANTGFDVVWILSDGTIYEVRLGQRKVRTLLTNRPEFLNLARAHIKRDGRSYLQLLVRTDRGLLMIDPETLAEQFTPLDPPMHGDQENLYQLADGRRLFTSTHYSFQSGDPTTTQLYWLDESGGIERRGEVILASVGGTTVFELTLGVGVTVPAPIISLATIGIAPLVSPRMPTEPASYLGRVGYYAATFKVWLITSLIIGGLTAWAARRRERDVFHNESWLWPILVGLCGWFGWMGYICLRPLPARLPHGAWFPAQPEPNRPLGTEIFA